MARVSRRAGIERKKEKSVVKAVLYARVSVDYESESVDNQLCLLRDYASKLGVEVKGEYVDIGKSGTNYRRSGFESMMKEIYSGEIRCVLVKDLSRLGRNYIETGEYIEKVFPMLGIRFIAVDDNYDSDSYMGDNVLFNYTVKNLVNEMYARDISKKVSSGIKAKQQSGKAYRSPVIPYGYRLNCRYDKCEINNKDNYVDIENNDYENGIIDNNGKVNSNINNNNKENSNINNNDKGNSNYEYIYEIDENVAWVVKSIFDKYHNGMSITDITRWLNDNKVSPPEEYRKTGKVYSDNKSWCKSSVYRILINKIYRGTMEINKTSTSFYADVGKHSTDIDDRIYISNAAPLYVIYLLRY